MLMKIRSRAPLRLGLAGGGTDLSPYCDTYGGAILNATIDLYAYAVLENRTDNKCVFIATDGDITETVDADPQNWSLSDPLVLHKAVYKRIVSDFRGGIPFPCTLTTFCEAPPGSGLGSSSTLVVAMLKAFTEYLGLPLGEYDVAQLAFDIERVDAGLAGGRQDQYAATFGGFNFMEFHENNRVIVNPLRVKNWILSELESSIVLFYTGVSRASADIISEQTKNISAPPAADSKPIAAMHELKEDAYAMKEAILKGDIPRFAEIMNKSWIAKRKTAASISNSRIDGLFDAATSAGALAGKVSGAGGGGFINFIVDPAKRMQVIKRLSQEEGQVMTCSFTKRGTEGWRV
jgi:D-glycero-alpha-D-manno-heptose-7-phosphate kinase